MYILVCRGQGYREKSTSARQAGAGEKPAADAYIFEYLIKILNSQEKNVPSR
jgi:hypothetical protein